MDRRIPLMRPHFDDEEIEELRKVLESGWVAQGPRGTEFERLVCEKIGSKHAVAVTNCTAALHLALLSQGIGQGDEVLVADYTYPATGHSVVYTGARPVFVDIDPVTYNIDPRLIENKITPKTRAIIPVHTFGQAADMKPIMEIARDHNLKVIEDAACSFGSKYDGKHTGTIGDIGCFSFHARKGITTGEGGMVVTDDEAIARMVRKLTVFGIQSAWEREGDGFFVPEFNALGYNYKMSDITAAVGIVQLRKLDAIISRKRELANYWDRKLESISGFAAPGTCERADHIYQSYVGLVGPGIDRNSLITKLAEKGVQAQIGTYASHVQPVYGSDDKCPNSLDVFKRAMALPLYYTMNESDIDLAAGRLAEAIKELKGD